MTVTRTAAKWVAAGLAVLGATQLWARGHPGADGRASAAERRAAPSLSLPDLSGKTVDLASLRGRAVAVNFWASWCPPCRFEIPELSAYYRENHDRCFELLGVAEDSGGPGDVASAAKAFGIAYPVLLDARGAVANRFGVSGLPHTVIIDAQGKVRRVFEGAIDRHDLERALGPLLAPRGTPCPRA